MEVQSVSKIFGSVIALKDISMKVNAGEVMCLLGDNGAASQHLSKSCPAYTSPARAATCLRGKKCISPRRAMR